MKNKIDNEKGLTLIEVLLSITILSIILVSMMYIFPQMGFMNQKNEEKTQAINTTKQILIEWKNNQEVKNFLSNPTLYTLPDYLKEQDTHYYTETTRDNIKVIIKIAKESDLKSNPAKAYQIHVQLLDQNGAIISESFGYIIVEA